MKRFAAGFALVCGLAIAGHAEAETLRTRAGAIDVERLAKLNNPWGMAFLPDGRLLVTEKPGRLRIYDNGRLSAPIKGVPSVVYKDQGGLLDVAIDPQFERNRFVYLSYTERAGRQPRGARVKGDPRLGPFVDERDNVLKGGAVARGKLVGNRLVGTRVIWRQVPKIVGLNHFGGRLLFDKGYLYITSGDRQSFTPAQDPQSNLGKIVRIDPDGSLPRDNPLRGKGRGDVFTLGNRNPLGIAVNPQTGTLWENEMGPKGGDELNIVRRGRNYGWPNVSNGNNYDDTPIAHHDTTRRYQKPLRSWNPVISPSGLAFYQGDLLPWRGDALIGGLSSQALIRLAVRGDHITGEERIPMRRRIRDVTEAPDGAVLLLTDGRNGELLRLAPSNRVAAR